MQSGLPFLLKLHQYINYNFGPQRIYDGRRFSSLLPPFFPRPSIDKTSNNFQGKSILIFVKVLIASIIISTRMQTGQMVRI